MKKNSAVIVLAVLFAGFMIVACGSSSSGGGTPFISLVNTQAASVVIGQLDFESGDINQGGGPSEYTFKYPYGTPAVIEGVLYLPDYSNDRVLGYNKIPSINNAPADFVLGWPDFGTVTEGTSALKFNGVQSISGYGGKMSMVDYVNNRVLIWNDAPTVTNTPVDLVVGQAAFDTSVAACDASSLYEPEDAIIVDGKLIVADASNNRVLIWNTIPTTNGEPADIVLGQPDLISCTTDNGGLSASSLDYPNGLWSDGKKLIVADANNNRVLIWNTFPASNGEAADLVVGQLTMDDDTERTTRSGFYWPPYISSNGKQLFVDDYGNHRVMVWNTIPSINNAPADVVLGQPDFETSVAGTSATAFTWPSGVLAVGDKLIVGDANNSRYLVFDSQ